MRTGLIVWNSVMTTTKKRVERLRIFCFRPFADGFTHVALGKMTMSKDHRQRLTRSSFMSGRSITVEPGSSQKTHITKWAEGGFLDRLPDRRARASSRLMRHCSALGNTCDQSGVGGDTGFFGSGNALHASSTSVNRSSS